MTNYSSYPCNSQGLSKAISDFTGEIFNFSTMLDTVMVSLVEVVSAKEEFSLFAGKFNIFEEILNFWPKLESLRFAIDVYLVNFKKFDRAEKCSTDRFEGDASVAFEMFCKKLTSFSSSIETLKANWGKFKIFVDLFVGSLKAGGEGLSSRFDRWHSVQTGEFAFPEEFDFKTHCYGQLFNRINDSSGVDSVDSGSAAAPAGSADTTRPVQVVLARREPLKAESDAVV